MSPDGYPLCTIQPARLRVSGGSRVEEPSRGAPAQANTSRTRNDDVVCNGRRDCRRLPASGVRVGSDTEPSLPPPTARCTAPPAPVFPVKYPYRPEVSAPQPTRRRCFCLACWGRIGGVAPRWLRPAGTPAEHPAPSEIVESFRNLGRFPPSPPRSVAAASRPTRCFDRAKPAARPSQREVDPPLQLP